MSFFDDDIVKDILRRAVEAAARDGAFTDALAMQIERQVRQDWGGENPYIAHGKTDRIIERNDKIIELWDAGQRDVRVLASRFGLSTKQVRRIVGR